MSRDEIVGTTALGRPIEAVVMTPPRYARPRPPAVVFGAIHGDEPATRLMAERLIEELLDRPPGRETWIIPVINVDGLLAGSKNNARDVDLNRNFAATSWTATYAGGYHPGAHPESEPETQALVALIENRQAAIPHFSLDRIVERAGHEREVRQAMLARAIPMFRLARPRDPAQFETMLDQTILALDGIARA